MSQVDSFLYVIDGIIVRRVYEKCSEEWVSMIKKLSLYPGLMLSEGNLTCPSYNAPFHINKYGC